MSSICTRGWCFSGSCSSATSAVASASVKTHSSWPVIPFFGMSCFPRCLWNGKKRDGEHQQPSDNDKRRNGGGGYPCLFLEGISAHRRPRLVSPGRVTARNYPMAFFSGRKASTSAQNDKIAGTKMH